MLILQIRVVGMCRGLLGFEKDGNTPRAVLRYLLSMTQNIIEQTSYAISISSIPFIREPEDNRVRVTVREYGEVEKAEVAE